jgi:hypothetical protein
MDDSQKLNPLDRFLRCSANWSSPASRDRRQALEELFGGQLPSAVSYLYGRADGSPDEPRINGEMLTFRLFSSEEAAEVTRAIRELDYVLIGAPVWFFGDFQSNCVGVYSQAPLTGFVTAFDHEEPDVSPMWRDVPSFLDALMRRDGNDDVPLNLQTIPTDLPARGHEIRTSEAAIGRDFVGQALNERNEELKLAYMFAGARLLAPEDATLLLPFLDVDHIWMPERAAEMMGLWDVEAAVPQLVELAKRGKANGNRAAVRALTRMRNQSAKRALRGLQSSSDPRIREFLEKLR